MTTATEPRAPDRVTHDRLEHRYADLMWTVEPDARSESGWLPAVSKTYNRLDDALTFIVAHVAGDDVEKIDLQQSVGEVHDAVKERVLATILAALAADERPR